MPGSTTFAAIKFAEGPDEVNKFPAEVSSPGAKTIDEYLEAHTLSYKTRAASFEAKSGEVAECTKAITVTLPAATVNRLIGVVAIPAVAGELVKITTSGGAFIIGDFITVVSKTATITLTEQQHVLLFANGTNWFIIAGEPKREQAYGAKNAIPAGKEETPSTVRPTEVIFSNEGTGSVTITVGGVAIGKYEGVGALSFTVQPEIKWKWEGTATLGKASYRTL